jgi:hypothetical protein
MVVRSLVLNSHKLPNGILRIREHNVIKGMNMVMRCCVLTFACCLMLLNGCSEGPSPVVGGTAGSLVAGGIPIPDFEVMVYKSGSTVPLGMGTTGNDGKFQLVLPKGEGPLWLETGEYVFTLESLGPEAPRMSATYSNAAKTPIKMSWKSDDKSLELKIPAFK